MRKWSFGGGRNWWKQKLWVNSLNWVMWLNYVKYSEDKVSSVRRILSTEKSFGSSTFFEKPKRLEVEAITPEIFKNYPSSKNRRKLPSKKCDASTSQSNDFGVSRKRFKPLIPGFTMHIYNISISWSCKRLQSQAKRIEQQNSREGHLWDEDGFGRLTSSILETGADLFPFNKSRKF